MTKKENQKHFYNKIKKKNLMVATLVIFIIVSIYIISIVKMKVGA